MKIGDRVGAPSWVALLAPAGGGLGSVFFPFPLPRRAEPKGRAVGSMWYSCNLTGHLRGNLKIVYVVFLKVQIPLGRKIVEFNLFYL